LALGIPHPDYLLECLNSKQIRDWEIIDSIEPIGQEADFYRTGIIASTLINIKLKKGVKKLSPLEFMPSLYTGMKGKKQQSWEDMKEVLSSMAGKKVKKHG